MEGGMTQIVVGVLKNGSQTAVEPQENACATEDVMAVAFWPRNLLEPGANTEVVVVRHRAIPEPKTVRPLLVRE
jgi:conjugal transfer pilus assembly protein TraK